MTSRSTECSCLELLDDVANASYAGIDLGPLGYLGSPGELTERLGRRHLTLAGGYFAVPFSDPTALPEELVRLDSLLDTFDAASSNGAGAAEGTPAPKSTIADAGSETRAQFPGRVAGERSLGWDEEGWTRFADSLAKLVARCRERGYEPTFHPHTATYVEAPWEIEQIARAQRRRRMPRHRPPATGRWRPGDRGRRLTRADQPDIIPDPSDPSDPSDPAGQAAGDQAANREYLRARGI